MNRAHRRAQRFERTGQKPVTAARVLGDPIAFAAEPAADGFVTLAYEVSMKETGVSLTRQMFEECVRNFGAYPCSPVTIEHEDLNPFSQNAAWAEPNGHIEELRVGTYKRSDGRVVASLEGRPSYEPHLDGKVGAGKKWRYGSVTVLPGAVDEETGNTLGAMLWSWSLTSHPRLTDLPAIAASRRAGAIEAGWWYGDIDDRDDVLAMLRSVLDLPVTSTETEVLAELAKLEALAADETAADASGIDVDCIVGKFRDALRLPALTTTTEVLAEVREALDTMPAEGATPADGMPAASMSRGPRAAQPTETKTMKTFLEMAKRLGIPAASEDEAREAVMARSQLGADALTALGLKPGADAAALAARVTELTAAAGRVPALEQELATFRAEAATALTASRNAWLDDLVAASPSLAPVRASLALHAERDWQGFQTTYPRPTREALSTAAAEAQQRAQDPQRTAPVTASAGTKDAPKPTETPSVDRKGLAAVLEEFGIEPTAEAVLQAVSQAHTPTTLRAALEQQAG